MIEEAFKVFPVLYEHTENPNGDINKLLNLNLKYSTEAEKQYCLEYLKCLQSVLFDAIQTRLSSTLEIPKALQESIKMYEMLKAETVLKETSDDMAYSSEYKNTSNN